MRKRVNISVDSLTYDRLQKLCKTHRFRNACELVTALIHILLDRLEPKERQHFDLPDEDDIYITEMFDDLGHTQRQPNGEVPKRKHRKSLNDYGKG